jgi:hypothetical protein
MAALEDIVRAQAVIAGAADDVSIAAYLPK